MPVLESTYQATIGDATFERFTDGRLTVVTVGGTDPAFTAEQADEVGDFLSDSDAWVTAHEKAAVAPVAKPKAKARSRSKAKPKPRAATSAEEAGVKATEAAEAAAER